MSLVQFSKKRKEEILLTLDKLGYASRSQLQRLHNLGGNRNAQRVMKTLSNYVHSLKHNEYVFYLNKRGRDLIGSDKVRTRSINVDHTLMRNEIYILYNKPKYWWIEHPIKVNGKPFIVADVLFAHDPKDQRFLLEVDCSQTMANNKKKIEKYVELKKMNNDYLPTLIWLTRTDSRKDKLKEISKKLNDVYVLALGDI